METERPEVMVATVGKQPMPVLIPILQFEPATVHLIVTREVQGVARRVRQVLRDFPKLEVEIEDTAVVNPYRAEQTRELCLEILGRRAGKGPPAIVNITGGTTLMALGAQQAALAARVPLLYVNTDDAVIIHFSPDGQETGRDPIAARPSVEPYLVAHGASILPPTPWAASVAADNARLQRFVEDAHIIAEAGSHSARLMDAIRQAWKQHDRGGALAGATAAERTLAEALATQGRLADLVTGGGALTFRVVEGELARDFLDGHWLELYVYDACKNSGLFDDVLISTRIERKVESRTVDNELDVVAIHRGRLAVVSCKSGRRMEEEDKRAPLWELDSLLQAELMGLYARKLLVTNRERLTDGLLDRARLSQIRPITGRELVDVARLIRQHLEGPTL